MLIINTPKMLTPSDAAYKLFGAYHEAGLKDAKKLCRDLKGCLEGYRISGNTKIEDLIETLNRDNADKDIARLIDATYEVIENEEEPRVAAPIAREIVDAALRIDAGSISPIVGQMATLIGRILSDLPNVSPGSLLPILGEMDHAVDSLRRLLRNH